MCIFILCLNLFALFHISEGTPVSYITIGLSIFQGLSIFPLAAGILFSTLLDGFEARVLFF